VIETEVRSTVSSARLHPQRLTVRGAEIACYEMGEGRPILFLHGSPDTHVMWLPLMGELAGYGRLIAPDLPGFGDSTLPDRFPLTLDHMADFIHDLIRALQIDEPVVLITTDFGGHYGPAFAVKYPDAVKGIVISNTNFFRDYQWHPTARLYRLPLMGELLLKVASRSMIHKAIKDAAPALSDLYIDESYSSGFGSARVRKTILRMYRERDSQDFAGWDERLVALLKHKPALVLWGDQDPFITPDYAERFGAAQVHHFAEYSHWLPLEAPEPYAAQVRPWLESL
jgi:pimeloyl-ACP methyl ester carboxylesterase